MKKFNQNFLIEKILNEYIYNEYVYLTEDNTEDINQKADKELIGKFSKEQAAKNSKLKNDIDKENLRKLMRDKIIPLQSDEGKAYLIVPNDMMKDVRHINKRAWLLGTATQPRLHGGNTLALHFSPNISQNDINDLPETEDAIIISYHDYEINPSLQLELGPKLIQYYKEKNISPEEQVLAPYNSGLLKRYIAHKKALRDDPKYRENLLKLKGEERDKYQKEYLNNAIKKHKKYSKDFTPISVIVPRPDQAIDEKQIILVMAKNKLRSLNPQDREMFNRVQRAITGPFITKQSPRDLMLLLNNFKELEAKSKDDNELRDNWRKLQLAQFESIYIDLIMSSANLLTEEYTDNNSHSLEYNQRVLFKILTNSGVYFSPYQPEFLANLQLFNDHWSEIRMKNSTNLQIRKEWEELVQKFWPDYYVPLIIRKLIGEGYINIKFEDIDIEKTIENFRSLINNDVFNFQRFTKYKDKERLVYKAISSEKLDKFASLDKAKFATFADKRKSQKDKDLEDLINQAMFYHKGGQVPKESKYDAMILKVLKEQIN